jgi:hypothetical protein
MPSPTHASRREADLPADPLRPSSPRKKQPQVLDVGSRECDPTSTARTANIDEIGLSGTLAPALRRVRTVVARITHRLSAAQTTPGTPPGAD